MTYTPWRIARWTAVNGAFAWGVWLALYDGSERADNLITFFTGLNAFFALFFLNDEVKRAVRKDGFSVPHGVDAAYDLVMIAAFASEARWWLAAAWVWIMISAAGVRDGADKGATEAKN